MVLVAVRAPGLAGQRLHAAVPARFPEVDIRPAFVVFPVCTAHAIFLCVLHQGLPTGHVLCYTLTHEGTELLFGACWCRNLTIPYEGSVLLLFYSLFLALLSNMYRSATIRCPVYQKFLLTLGGKRAILRESVDGDRPAFMAFAESAGKVKAAQSHRG